MPSLFFFVLVSSKCDLLEKKKRSARYEETSPAVTKGLVMRVPLPELEVDDTEVELNKGGRCAEAISTTRKNLMVDYHGGSAIPQQKHHTKR